MGKIEAFTLQGLDAWFNSSDHLLPHLHVKRCAQLRAKKGLKQSAIPGLSERQLRRIEHGERVSSSALESLAAAHGMPLRRYLDYLARLLSPSPVAVTSAAGATE